MTFDGGRTRAVNTNDLLGITLSDGTKYTPSTNSSSTTPISLPVAGQSFADISMLVPTNTNSVELSTLIGPPNNFWGDDDGDANVTAIGTLSLSIVDKNNQAVSRNTVPEVCKAPYKVTLSSTNGTLTTSYGVPNRSNFSANSVIYYVNPKSAPVVCFARPNLQLGSGGYAGPASVWNPVGGFIPQTSYGSNFPTTGSNGLYFDLDIGGNNQALSWSSVSQGGITVNMSNSTATRVHVTLTGPAATLSQHSSSNPGSIPKPTLPQIFELVGRDSRGNDVLKYGFILKKWFVNRGSMRDDYSNTLSWCNRIGYRMSRVRDLTNAVRGGWGWPISGATPNSPGNWYQRRIGAGFFTEWGGISSYSGSGFVGYYNYWTSDPNGSDQFVVKTGDGNIFPFGNGSNGLCAYP
ncbi:hypothetical protein A9G08_08290 [Gilliamella sp. wkB195]|nr:hypothetical protein A9G08_08290 [Gilliamella apicola]